MTSFCISNNQSKAEPDSIRYHSRSTVKIDIDGYGAVCLFACLFVCLFVFSLRPPFEVMEVWLESLGLHLAVGAALPQDLVVDIYNYSGWFFANSP